MGVDKRTFILSNEYRHDTVDTPTDMTLVLPDSIFSGKLDSIVLNHLFIDCDYEVLGATNNVFSVAYPSNTEMRQIKLSSIQSIQKDDDLALLIANSLNLTFGTTAFQVYHTNIVTYEDNAICDNIDTLGNYIIFTTNGVEFVLDFDHRNSIGPLLGFGRGIYRGASSYKSGNSTCIYVYNSIHISNKAYDPLFSKYRHSADIACKMDLYNSDGALIPNQVNIMDTTISLPVFDGYVYSIADFIRLLTDQLNLYSKEFTDNPQFIVTYDYNNGKFTITNSTQQVFGIGFRFNRMDQPVSINGNNYGSLHRHLGFYKQNYLGVTSITSTYPAKIFNRFYGEEYLFICSDLIRHNYDTSVIVPGSNKVAAFYESLFTIPMSSLSSNGSSSFYAHEYTAKIHTSLLAKQYNENLNVDKTINFYLKTSSGRHIKLHTHWSMRFDIEYNN